MKKSPNWFKGFVDRQCSIENKIFRYYLPNDKNKAFGILNFDIVTYDFTV